MDEKKRKIVCGIIIAVYIAILFVVGKEFVERAVVKAGAVASLELIKHGLPDELLDEIIDDFLSESIGIEKIRKALRTAINGENINDIYSALLYRMDYDVEAVEKVAPGDYRVGIIVRNNNNIMVGKKVATLLLERYGNDPTRLLSDLRSDKSQLIRDVLIEAADLLAQQETPDLYSEQYYVISVGSDGHLAFENKNDISFVLLCAGIPIGSAPSDEITDEYKIYLIILLILIAVPVVLFLYHRSKNPDDNVAVDSNKSIEDKNPAEKAAGKRIAILYAKTPQHNNMPFAVHSTPIFIGRDPASCKILFGEGAVGVSRKHCCIRYDASAEAFVLTDLRSTYGTYLNNGRKLEPDKLYNLKPGDSFYAGDKANMFSVELN